MIALGKFSPPLDKTVKTFWYKRLVPFDGRVYCSDGDYSLIAKHLLRYLKTPTIILFFTRYIHGKREIEKRKYQLEELLKVFMRYGKHIFFIWSCSSRDETILELANKYADIKNIWFGLHFRFYDDNKLSEAVMEKFSELKSDRFFISSESLCEWFNIKCSWFILNSSLTIEVPVFYEFIKKCAVTNVPLYINTRVRTNTSPYAPILDLAAASHFFGVNIKNIPESLRQLLARRKHGNF